MRLIDADALLKCIPPEETCSRFAVANAPTVEPERKKGKWTDDNACLFCGFQPWYERDIHTLSFCPNCGADMRGDKDDQR